MSQECDICFLPNQSHESTWTCGHSFCKECTISWDGTCPICRSDRIFTPLQPYKSKWCCFSCSTHIVPIQHYVKSPKRHFPVTVDHYFTKWDKKVCIKEHRIRFDHRDGEIFATCELCGYKKLFPYMG